MTSGAIIWRHHVGLSPNFQEMFLFMVSCCGANIKSFAPFKRKLWACGATPPICSYRGVDYICTQTIKMEEVAIIWNLTTHKMWKNTIKNDKNHKKINNLLNNFMAEIGKSAKQLQAEPKKMGCL